MLRLPFLITSFVLSSLCLNAQSGVFHDMDLSSNLKKAAIDTLFFQNSSYVVDVYLSRDFMPPRNVFGGTRLFAIVELICVDSTKVSEDLNMIAIHVVFGDSVWCAPLESSHSAGMQHKSRRHARRNSPKWGPDVFVDVYLSISSKLTNEAYILRKAKVKIIRTI
jgi:hypothetical protein